MIARGFAIVPFLALLAACGGGAGTSSVPTNALQPADGTAMAAGKNPGNAIAWKPKAITLRGDVPRPRP